MTSSGEAFLEWIDPSLPSGRRRVGGDPVLEKVERRATTQDPMKFAKGLWRVVHAAQGEGDQRRVARIVVECQVVPVEADLLDGDVGRSDAGPRESSGDR